MKSHAWAIIAVLVLAIATPLGSAASGSLPHLPPGVPSTLVVLPSVSHPYDAKKGPGSDDIPLDDSRLKRAVTGNTPEQIKVGQGYSPTEAYLSWSTGEPQVGKTLKPVDPSSVASFALWGTAPGKYDAYANGKAVVYSQVYTSTKSLNYRSGIQHHVKLTGLQPNTTYFYRVGDAEAEALSAEFSFTTLPGAWGAKSFPVRFGMVADLGTTYNSSSTLEHVASSDVDMVLFIGDFCYADNYMSDGSLHTDWSAPMETYQPRWDAWMRFVEPQTRSRPWMFIEGNHEIETQADGTKFASYLARVPVNSQANDSGSPTGLYYSFESAGVHFIMIGAYAAYDAGSAQMAWLKRDLAAVNRTRTPWVIATWHPPTYNTYTSHFREVEPLRVATEQLLYDAGVDAVFVGHVHAYERTNRVLNYALDPCAPLYITIGDGGNREKLSTTFAEAGTLCASGSGKFAQPQRVTRPNGTGQQGVSCPNQPAWSAFREPSFGHGTLDVLNSTYAFWQWHRNDDGVKVVRDQVIIVRQPGVCRNQPSL